MGRFCDLLCVIAQQQGLGLSKFEPLYKYEHLVEKLLVRQLNHPLLFQKLTVCVQ